MSGHIFPIKALTFASALRAVRERIEANNRDCRGLLALGDEDGRLRMVLWSPEVKKALSTQLGNTSFRVRLAIPKDERQYGKLEMPTLELYGPDGSLLGAPTPLPELGDALANAVQVELLQFLLESRGLKIPML